MTPVEELQSRIYDLDGFIKTELEYLNEEDHSFKNMSKNILEFIEFLKKHEKTFKLEVPKAIEGLRKMRAAIDEKDVRMFFDGYDKYIEGVF